MGIDIFCEGLRMRILESGNGSWKREFLPGVETLRDTGTMHISCFLGLFFIFFSDARKYKETAQIGSYVFNISCSFHFRLGDFLRVKDTVNHDVVSYPWKV